MMTPEQTRNYDHWSAEIQRGGLFATLPYPGAPLPLPPPVVPVTVPAEERRPASDYVYEDEEEWEDGRWGFVSPCSLRARIWEPAWSWRKFGRTLAYLLLACVVVWAVCVGAAVVGGGGRRP